MPSSIENMFLAMLALVVIQVQPVSTASFWADVPHPPLLHPVGWEDDVDIRMMTNDTGLMGGHANFSSHLTATVIKYKKRPNSTSIYITVIETPLMGCLPIAYKTFLSDAPDELAPKKLLPHHIRFI